MTAADITKDATGCCGDVVADLDPDAQQVTISQADPQTCFWDSVVVRLLDTDLTRLDTQSDAFNGRGPVTVTGQSGDWTLPLSTPFKNDGVSVFSYADPTPTPTPTPSPTPTTTVPLAARSTTTLAVKKRYSLANARHRRITVAVAVSAPGTTLVGGSATVRITKKLTRGSHQLSASYSGDAGTPSSTSATVTLKVRAGKPRK